MYTDIFPSTFLQPVNGSKSSVEVFSTDMEKKIMFIINVQAMHCTKNEVFH